MKVTSRRRCAAKRKPRHLDPALLARLDDTVVNLLIDEIRLRQVNFPATTRKSSAEYFPLRHINKIDVSKILGETRRFNIQRTQNRILQLPCLKGYVSSNGAADLQSQWFSTQLNTYLHIYDPKCPFRIAESAHLSDIDREAAVFANCTFKTGETIQFLSGVCVPLTKKDELQLEKSGKDFSILRSSRSSRSPALAMFLGPARFVNHDCNANCEIVWAEESQATIVAIKDIHPNDEITVFYGTDYFGENNQECLCWSCSAHDADL